MTFTPDGKSLIVRELDGLSGFALLKLLPLEGDRTPKPLMRTPVNAGNVTLSADGHWLAYQSTESGQDDIHIRPFPEVESGHWQISTEGGSRPVWAPSGHELFYLDARYRLMTVTLQTTPFSVSTPSVAFQFVPPPTGLARYFDVTPDGTRFVAIKSAAEKEEAAQPNQLRVILHWDEELKRLAPAKR